MKVPNENHNGCIHLLSLSRLQNEGSQHHGKAWVGGSKSIKATE